MVKTVSSSLQVAVSVAISPVTKVAVAKAVVAPARLFPRVVGVRLTTPEKKGRFKP